jgi:hypothetical protein
MRLLLIAVACLSLSGCGLAAFPCRLSSGIVKIVASLLDRQHLYAAGLGEPAILE